MIDLVLVFALATGAPIERRLAFADAMSCLLAGQTEAARLAQAHPGWRLVRFTCERAGGAA